MHYRLLPRAVWPLAVVLIAVAITSSSSLANHGPGTSGGGSSTASGETLKPGQFDLSLRVDYTKFENISRTGAERIALRSGEFDALDDATITTVGISYGLVEDIQISAAIGYYWGQNFVDAESEDGIDAESATADPEGLTDLNLSVKWRIVKGAPGNIALIGGVIAPTGRDDVRLSNGELLEPSSQPGTGAWAFQAGIAYSRFLTSRVTNDASGIYTFRTEHDGFEVGDRADLGVAFAYRLTESIRSFPNCSVFIETNAIWLGKDESDAEGKNPNSGGWTVYLTPGGRVRFNEHLALTVAPSIPILQELNGEQIESEFKLSATLSYSF
ncbi:MAG TPA: transporter [Tepidisphaeraceae bacterium]|jgi:hypothetical protein